MVNEDLCKNKEVPFLHPLEDCTTRAANFVDNPDNGLNIYPIRPTPISHQAWLYKKLVAHLGIFVDNFCGLGQDHKMKPLLNRWHILILELNLIVQPSDKDDEPFHQEPILVKILDKQDGN